MDLVKLGWLQLALNAGGIALAFVLAGFLLVRIDCWRPLGPRRSSALPIQPDLEVGSQPVQLLCDLIKITQTVNVSRIFGLQLTGS